MGPYSHRLSSSTGSTMRTRKTVLSYVILLPRIASVNSSVEFGKFTVLYKVLMVIIGLNYSTYVLVSDDKI